MYCLLFVGRRASCVVRRALLVVRFCFVFCCSLIAVSCMLSFDVGSLFVVRCWLSLV